MIKKFLKFRAVSLVCAAGLVLVLSGFFWAYISLRQVGWPIVVHFNNLAGINQIGGISELLYVGITGTVVVLVNSFISLELEERDGFWGKLLASATLLFGILIFIYFAAIISVN
ncbi:MAG: hypothetical protein KGJ89_04530 [Patescibacteria group bacterium]|nr:hypothetical protein [Patescibacteria group bacterium]MDE2015818.1 hypothetical protein [Patescibacteria group bacterium]MDE2227193.1 hypothetical protein [Patescibacteria group bacterium]